MELFDLSFIDEISGMLESTDLAEASELLDADINLDVEGIPFNDVPNIDNSPSLESINTEAAFPEFDDWFNDTHGTPAADSLVWHQQTTDFSCGIVSSEMVMNMFGLEISEAQLVFEATSQGLLTENGMSIDGIAQILENHGIETHVGQGGIDDLSDHLDKGRKIIVGLDSGEIWGEDSAWEDWSGERADHAVVVTGVDQSGPVPTVTLNDPGHPDGKAMVVDLETFMDAWKDSGNEYITTVHGTVS